MITETGKFFSVPCERPQRWSPPFWKRQLPQTKLLGITHTRLYNDVSSGNFQAKGLSCYHRGLTILFNLTKMGLSDKVFSIQNNNNKKKPHTSYNSGGHALAFSMAKIRHDR